MKFDVRQFKDFIDCIDKLRNLQVRALITEEEAEKLTNVTKDQLTEYINSVYKEPAKPEKPEPKKVEKSSTPDARKQDKQSPSSK